MGSCTSEKSFNVCLSYCITTYIHPLEVASHATDSCRISNSKGFGWIDQGTSRISCIEIGGLCALIFSSESKSSQHPRSTPASQVIVCFSNNNQAPLFCTSSRPPARVPTSDQLPTCRMCAEKAKQAHFHFRQTGWEYA